VISDRNLEDKVAVITGGGTGLGLEIAKVFVQKEMKVVICSRSKEHLDAGISELGKWTKDTLAVTCDVREPEQIRTVKKEILRKFNQIDILVNNAAGNFIYPAEKLPLKGWKAVIDIVLNGSFYCSQIFGEQMIAQKQGQIINILATYAWTGGPGTIHSACAKAGVLAMTRTLAVEWARYGVRVNAIAPGPFDTEGASVRLWPTEEMKQRLVEDIPLQRFASVTEVAHAVLYLISSHAQYINGECLTIDGGAWLGKGIGRISEILDQVVEIREIAKKTRAKNND
jgi:NAD(P)-dependent dehydrogenase (short-subunit alcohol dehydrogenase family)